LTTFSNPFPYRDVILQGMLAKGQHNFLHNAIPTPYHKYEYVSAYGNSAFRNIPSERGLEKLSLDIVMELVKYLRHPSPL
jgi:hypothetical protein